jgi:hypothetical protein
MSRLKPRPTKTIFGMASRFSNAGAIHAAARLVHESPADKSRELNPLQFLLSDRRTSRGALMRIR